MLKRKFVPCVLGLALTVNLGVGCAKFDGSPRGDSKLEKRINGLLQADPATDAAFALRRGDQRFIATQGLTISVPTVPDGTRNSLVFLHGVKPLVRTSTIPLTVQEKRFKDVAYAYATRYNMALLQNLLSKPDPKTLRLLAEIRAELSTLEHGNPQQAALRAVKSGQTRFIYVAGESNHNLPDAADKLIHQIGTRTLKSNALVLSGPDLQRFQNVMKNFVIPYNRRLYGLLKNQPLKSRSGGTSASRPPTRTKRL